VGCINIISVDKAQFGTKNSSSKSPSRALDFVSFKDIGSRITAHNDRDLKEIKEMKHRIKLLKAKLTKKIKLHKKLALKPDP
jgi:hypothetical protein